MHNVSNIGFVDSHSEGNSRTQDADPTQTPLSMTSAFLGRIQLRMIEGYPHIAKPLLPELLIQLVANILAVLPA